jgi:hypothetical protein
MVLKNLRFVAGALATGFVSLPLLAWIAQSPVIIIRSAGSLAPADSRGPAL